MPSAPWHPQPSHPGCRRQAWCGREAEACCPLRTSTAPLAVVRGGLLPALLDCCQPHFGVLVSPGTISRHCPRRPDPGHYQGSPVLLTSSSGHKCDISKSQSCSPIGADLWGQSTWDRGPDIDVARRLGGYFGQTASGPVGCAGKQSGCSWRASSRLVSCTRNEAHVLWDHPTGWSKAEYTGTTRRCTPNQSACPTAASPTTSLCHARQEAGAGACCGTGCPILHEETVAAGAGVRPGQLQPRAARRI